MSEVRPESPRLQALQDRQGEDDGLVALTEFWDEVEAVGAPLIEPGEDDPGSCLVTFLWRETGLTDNVVVVGGVAGFGVDHGQMARLPGTNVWHWTSRQPSDLRATYRLAVNDQRLPRVQFPDADRMSGWLLDPLNPQVFHSARLPDEGEPHEEGFTDSIVELPDAPSLALLGPRDVPHGQTEMHRIGSEILGNQRRVWVYSPAAEPAGGSVYPLLVITDGEMYVQFLPALLDNLIAEGRIPPVMAALVANPTGDIGARMTELACSEPFAAFLAQELIPTLRGTHPVTHDPTETVIAGSSLGGLAATFAGLRHAEVFGNVLTQSGSFWWRPDEAEEHVWLARQFIDAPLLPLRVFQEVGRLERGETPGDGPSQVAANRHLRDVLRAKGYPVTYREYGGGHNYLAWQITLADGLMTLIGAADSS